MTAAVGARNLFKVDAGVVHAFRVERQIGDQLLPPGVRLLELLQPPPLRRRQPIKLRLPSEIGYLPGSDLAAVLCKPARHSCPA
jgi:hypothetical protein